MPRSFRHFFSSTDRVHFTPEPGEKGSHQGEPLEEPIPPRRAAQTGSTSYTPTTYTPVSASPSLVRPPTQHYEAPSHHGPTDIVNNADLELLERAMAGATWDHPANIRLRVVADFEPCCSVELRAYQDQLITGLFQNGAWVYVRASNGAEGYLPAASCTLSQDRPPSIDMSSSGVSSVGTVDDEVSNGGRSFSSLEQGGVEHGSMSSSSGLGMTSPHDGRTSGYSSEPEKSTNRVKFAPTASILQPGYRSVHIPEDYVAMYRQRPRTTSTSGSGWQGQRSGHGLQQGQQYHQPGVRADGHRSYGPGEISRARNMSYPQGRAYPGQSPLSTERHAPAPFPSDPLPYDANRAHTSHAVQASRSRRLIDRLKNFRSGTAPANVEVFEVDGGSSASSVTSGELCTINSYFILFTMYLTD